MLQKYFKSFNANAIKMRAFSPDIFFTSYRILLAFVRIKDLLR